MQLECVKRERYNYSIEQSGREREREREREHFVLVLKWPKSSLDIALGD